MVEETKPVSGKRVLLVLLIIAVIMQVLLALFILDVRRRRPAVVGPPVAPQSATEPAAATQPLE